MTTPEQPKKPLSEAPRFGSKLSQKGIQVEGVWAYCDPHPIYEDLFYTSHTSLKWYMNYFCLYIIDMYM